MSVERSVTDVDVDAEENVATTMKISIEELFADGQLRLYEDDHGWSGFVLEDEEWAEQIEAWASTIREKSPMDLSDMTDRELADQHITETFGVGLEKFEAQVVNFEPGQLVEALIAGNFRAARAGIQEVREEIESQP